jgi:hypothetical protein
MDVFLFKRTNILFWFALIGIFQSVLVNMFKVSLPLLNIYFFVSIVFLVLKKEKKNKFELFFLFVLLFLLVYGMIIASNDIRYILFHFNVILLIYWAISFNKRVFELDFRYFKIIIIIYCILSFIIYIFYWNVIASMISEQVDFINLKTMGFPRSFGLLFNPLAHAYFLLISFFLIVLYDKGLKSVVLIIITFSILISITRGAILSLVIFLMGYLFLNRKWGIITSMFLAFFASYLLIEPVTLIVDSIIKLKDSQGSIQAHSESLTKAIEALTTHPFGVGFSNQYVESWIFEYSYFYGWFGLIIFIVIIMFFILNLWKSRKTQELFVFFSLMPVFITIPFHTFNLPIAFCILMLTKMTFNNRNLIISE